MFGFDWSEIALIGVVALVLIGPKDLPVAIRLVTDGVKKMRRMAGEMQGHVDEMMREADLSEARDTFRDLRAMNLKSQVLRTIDGDGVLGRTLKEKPLQGIDLFAAGATGAAGTTAALPPPEAAPADPGGAMPGTTRFGLASFMPPPASDPDAPAFVPPGAPRSRRGRPPAFIPPASARG